MGLPEEKNKTIDKNKKTSLTIGGKEKCGLLFMNSEREFLENPSNVNEKSTTVFKMASRSPNNKQNFSFQDFT